MSIRYINTFVAILVMGLALGACSSGKEPNPTMPAMAPVQTYTEPEERFGNPGSIFTESASGLLFEDTRARRVGDIVLIKIVESTTAKSKADTTTERKGSNDIGVSAAFGRSNISPFIGGLGGKIGADPIIGTHTNSKHEATGETKRENNVSATIGGRVVNVLPNAILEVAGMREIKVNGETEYMVVRGLVRQSDVLSDNSVLSTQLANSSIEYYGEGVLADKQNPGWLTRLIDMIWPF